MTELPAEIFAQICGHAGIHATHADAFGKTAAASHAARRAILRDIGLGCDTADEAAAALALVQAAQARLLPQLAVVEAGRQASVALLHGAPEAARHARIVLEDGAALELDAGPHGVSLGLPPLPAGYHILTLEIQGSVTECFILAAPPRCYEPPELAQRRVWGVAAQVYGLHSQSSLGMGDFGDVAALARGAGAMGAAFAGLSPAHCLFPANRSMISPYSPSTRLYLDPIYLNLAQLPGFAGSPAAKLLSGMGDAVAKAQSTPLVDYPAVWALKETVLKAFWAGLRPAEHPEFAAFCASEGENLSRFAAFEALNGHFTGKGAAWSGAWPQDVRNAAAAGVASFARDHADEISYHRFLQWACDRQLADAAAAARQSGMAIGLYRDLAVGSDRGGCEFWAAPGAFAPNLSIGAPPDPLAPQGQNWGLPPFDPLHLAQGQLRAFRAPIAANMRHAGALRIDHAFQLARLFLVPPGVAPGDGAYVDYPLEAMLAVLRIESHRAKCLVIAEDLGTAPAGFSQQIMQSGLFSCKVVPFERGWAGSFTAAAHYPRQAMAMAATHDLPTFTGWWRGADIDLREKLGIYDFVTSLGLQAARRREISQFCEALAGENLLPSPALPAEPPIDAATAFLARTPCALAAVQLEDAVGEAEQANLPGVTAGHPNWQRRLKLGMEDLFAAEGGMDRLAGIMQAEQRAGLCQMRHHTERTADQ